MPGGSDVIEMANTSGTRIFTVGLSEGVNFGALDSMSRNTDGQFFFANDIQTLVTSFRALNHLIRGQYTVMRCTQEVTVQVPENQIPGYLYTPVHIDYTPKDAEEPISASALVYINF